jgi:hypothetical protein
MQSVNSSSSSNSSTRSANSSSCSSLHVYTWAPLNQVLGWATFPHNFVVDPSKDGVVIAHTAIAGGTWENYNVGHTLTHEVRAVRGSQMALKTGAWMAKWLRQS